MHSICTRKNKKAQGISNEGVLLNALFTCSLFVYFTTFVNKVFYDFKMSNVQMNNIAQRGKFRRISNGEGTCLLVRPSPVGKKRQHFTK